LLPDHPEVHADGAHQSQQQTALIQQHMAWKKQPEDSSS
jgi:hypothetical protein